MVFSRTQSVTAASEACIADSSTSTTAATPASGSDAAQPLLLNVFRPGDPLPDLTDRLVELGVYQQYVSFRDGYKRWRQGGAQGAKGEATVSELAAKSSDEAFKYFYPDEVSVQFRETVAYWIGVLFIEGSLLFAWSGFFGAEGKQMYPLLADVLTVRPAFAGAICYTLGCYLVYFEVINLGIKHDSEVHFVRGDWEKLRETYYVEPSSILGGIAYFSGALLYQVSCTTGLFSASVPSHMLPYLTTLPTGLGGLLFFFGGLCEVVHNRIATSAPNTIVWWVSMFNFLGDVCFCLAGYPGFTDFNVNMMTFVGAISFTIGGMLSLGMWKVGQFGGALLAQLNAVARAKAIPITQRMQDGAIVVHEELDEALEPATISARGISFILIFATCGAVSIVNCCFFGMHPHNEIRDVDITAQEAINASIVHMVLIAMSAGNHRAPKEQPYRLLFFVMRMIITVMLAHGLFTSFIFLQEYGS
mmetsp:Transcript_30325/g.87465  ORF Transcript_30325/g.87465 Transcript_30325/m.87465 type:complete len:475 (-) Transcript_30325:73-1497(-)